MCNARSHTRIPTHTFTHTRSHTHVHTHTFTHTHSHTHIPTHIPTHTFPHTHSHTHISIHTFPHTHSHTHIPMHTFEQVFKFNPSNLLKPALTKGTAFMPGSGQDYFCQPAAVAVERSGMFYVADGYCNSRVVRFTKDGVWDIAWSDPVGEVPIPIRVAHSLVVLEEEKKLFLADRENGRILSYDTVTGEGRVFSDAPVFRGAMFAISFSANETWPMVAINGHTDHNSGFTINKKGAVISTWGPDKVSLGTQCLWSTSAFC